MMGLVAATCIFIACEAELEINQTVQEIQSAQPTITGFSPATAPVNSIVNIEGTFLNFANKVFINGIEAPIESRITGSRLQIRVPNNATSGSIRIVTEQDKEATSDQSLSITYPQPAVTSTFPANAFVNALINVVGTNLSSVTSVSFGNVAGTIEFQESQALSVRVPNNPGIRDVTLNYLSTSGPTSVTIATGFEIILPQPVLGGFPALITRDNDVVVSGQDINLVTDVNVNGTVAVISSISPTEVRFRVPAAIATGYVTINLNFQGGGTITRNNIPYINGQFESIYEFDSTQPTVFTLDTNVDPNARQQLNGTAPQPPFPGNSYYSLTMARATGSTIARSRIHQETSNPAYADILNPGNYNNSPVLHFWLNTEGTQPVIVLYFGGTGNPNRRRWQNATTNTGNAWQLCAVRLNGFIPNQTSVGGIFEVRATTGSTTPVLPVKMNFDWLIVTDRVLTEFGAVDVTDEFSPAG